jgi:hypothetical protein
MTRSRCSTGWVGTQQRAWQTPWLPGPDYRVPRKVAPGRNLGLKRCLRGYWRNSSHSEDCQAEDYQAEDCQARSPKTARRTAQIFKTYYPRNS